MAWFLTKRQSLKVPLLPVNRATAPPACTGDHRAEFLLVVAGVGVFSYYVGFAPAVAPCDPARYCPDGATKESASPAAIFCRGILGKILSLVCFENYAFLVEEF